MTELVFPCKVDQAVIERLMSNKIFGLLYTGKARFFRAFMVKWRLRGL